MDFTETDLRNIVREEIKKQCIFVKPSDAEDLEPMTYDYLINRNKGLPEEYFKPTNILYDPNEIAIHAFTNEESDRKDVNEGLIRTYPTAKALQFACTNLTNRGYPISPCFFSVNNPNDDRSIYGHILLKVKLNYLNKEINDILISSFNTCDYALGSTFNRIDTSGDKYVVFQFEPKFQDNMTIPTIGQYLYHVTTANAAKKIARQGFCPSNKTKNGFKYDSRCYFFTIYNKQLFAHYMKQANKQNVIGRNDYNYDFEIITIDRRLLNNVDFLLTLILEKILQFSHIPTYHHLLLSSKRNCKFIFIYDFLRENRINNKEI